MTEISELIESYRRLLIERWEIRLAGRGEGDVLV